MAYFHDLGLFYNEFAFLILFTLLKCLFLQRAEKLRIAFPHIADKTEAGEHIFNCSKEDKGLVEELTYFQPRTVLQLVQ